MQGTHSNNQHQGSGQRRRHTSVLDSKSGFQPTGKVITVPDIPKAGPYSHEVVAGNFTYLSGQIRTVQNAIAKVKKTLDSGGYTMEDVVKISVYLPKAGDFPKMNELYSKHFASNPQARTAVGDEFANSEIMVEISVIASK
jgi:Putative translation initiation inhibitor, yjgF family